MARREWAQAFSRWSDSSIECERLGRALGAQATVTLDEWFSSMQVWALETMQLRSARWSLGQAWKTYGATVGRLTAYEMSDEAEDLARSRGQLNVALASASAVGEACYAGLDALLRETIVELFGGQAVRVEPRLSLLLRVRRLLGLAGRIDALAVSRARWLGLDTHEGLVGELAYLERSRGFGFLASVDGSSFVRGGQSSDQIWFRASELRGAAAAQ